MRTQQQRQVVEKGEGREKLRVLGVRVDEQVTSRAMWHVVYMAPSEVRGRLF